MLVNQTTRYNFNEISSKCGCFVVSRSGPTTTKTTLITSTACVSAQVDSEELCLTVQVEIIVGRVRGDVVVRDQSKVKLEPSLLLVDDVKNLL